MVSLSRRLGAEFAGTAFLLATVVGSGIMGDQLSDGHVALALLANAVATGAILIVLITIFGPISGAHFNPAVTLVFWLRKELQAREAALYMAVQIVGALIGVWLAHVMFEEVVFQASTTARTGPSQWVAEWVATLGLAGTILLTLRHRPEMVASAVGLYITAAYWFTASTSFANPAVTVARGLSDTFSGIRPVDVPMFVIAQLIGAYCALLAVKWLTEGDGAPDL